MSPGFDFFPVQRIKRIEVVRGPGSSLYGENAFRRVINIVTLSGEDIAGTDAQPYRSIIASISHRGTRRALPDCRPAPSL